MTRLSKLEVESDERVQRERQRSDRLEKELVQANGQLLEMQAVMQLAIETDIDNSKDQAKATEMARLEAENAGLRELMGIAGVEVDANGDSVVEEEGEEDGGGGGEGGGGGDGDGEGEGSDGRSTHNWAGLCRVPEGTSHRRAGRKGRRRRRPSPCNRDAKGGARAGVRGQCNVSGNGHNNKLKDDATLHSTAIPASRDSWHCAHKSSGGERQACGVCWGSLREEMEARPTGK